MNLKHRVMHRKFLTNTFCISLCIHAFCVADASNAVNRYGILLAESSHEKETFCIIYFPELSFLHHKESEADFHAIQEENSSDFCTEKHGKDFDGKVVISNLNNCSLAEQAFTVQEEGGVGAIFVFQDQNLEALGNFSFSERLNLTVALLPEASAEELYQMAKPVSVKLFAPIGFSFDFSLLVIWIVAMFTVCVGGYWSGRIRHKLHCKETNSSLKINLDNGDGDTSVKRVKHANPEESSLSVSPYAVAAFVLCMGATLLLLYFFFDYLVYILIGLFVLVSINSVYVCLYPLVMKIFPHCCILFECQFLDGTQTFDLRHLFLLVVSISTSVAWVATRREIYSWILQDILGVLFCINMLKNVRMPSLKICALLLTLLFFYDIFFVFVTPFLTAEGGSVMEEVATGGNSKEKLPMVLRVPHFNLSPLRICKPQFSLLGFGDILIPGLLISYCYGFDLITSGKMRYYALVVTTYGIGLILTFIGVNLMRTAQPALLYLVPTTLLPPIILGWARGEMSLLWTGFKSSKPRGIEESDIPSATPTGCNTSSNVELASPSHNAQASTSDDTCSRENVIQIVNDSMNERKHLLH